MKGKYARWESDDLTTQWEASEKLETEFDELVLHYDTDVLLKEMAEALSRKAKKSADKKERKLLLEEARNLQQVASYISKFLYGRKDGR